MDQMRLKIQTGQAAQLLGVSRKTVIRQAEAGEIPTAERVGKKGAFVFDEHAVRELANLRLAEQRAALLKAEERLNGVAS